MSEQLDLLGLPALRDLPPPPARDIDTSIAAAESIAGEKVNHKRRIVLDCITAKGSRGATLDEVSVSLDMLMQTASARVRELAQAGYIEDTGDRRPTRTGRNARVYRATQRGAA